MLPIFSRGGCSGPASQPCSDELGHFVKVRFMYSHHPEQECAKTNSDKLNNTSHMQFDTSVSMPR